jgi:cell division GTPase FtsZ
MTNFREQRRTISEGLRQLKAVRDSMINVLNNNLTSDLVYMDGANKYAQARKKLVGAVDNISKKITNINSYYNSAINYNKNW